MTSIAAALVAGLVALAGAPAALAAPAPVPAQPATAFVDGLGVNTHFSWNDSAYCVNKQLMKDRLAELGVKHVRDGGESWAGFAGTNGCGGVQALNTLYQVTGIRTQAVLNALNRSVTTQSAAITALDSTGVMNDLLDAAYALKVTGALESIEGPNEYDTVEKTVNINVFDPKNWNSYVLPWRDRIASFMPELHSRSQARLPGVPVVNASFAYGPPRTYDPTNSYKAYARLGDRTSTFEIGNMHPYSGIDAPEGGVGAWFTDARAISRTLPLQATEIGYFDKVRSDGRYVSRRAASIYLLRHILEMAARGAQRTYVYELADGPAAKSDLYSWGLVDFSGAPKPAFLALKRLIAAMRDPQTTGTAPASVPLAVTGTGIRSHVVARRDGSYVVALWQPGAVWNTSSRTDVTPAAVAAQLTVDRAYDASTFRPADQTALTTPVAWTAAGQATSTQPLAVSVPGDPVLVMLKPR